MEMPDKSKIVTAILGAVAVYKICKLFVKKETICASCELTNGGRAVRLVLASIFEHKADVLVNSTQLSLDLKSAAALSMAVLEAAGDGLQQECTAKYPGGFKEGEVAVTGAYNLPHKAIYHVYCPPFALNGPQCLENNVKVCLRRAEIDGHVTVAFPALGCGGRAYPVHQVAPVMLRAIVRFLQQTQSSVKTVDVVIIETNIQVKEGFQEVLSQIREEINRPPRQRVLRRDEWEA